jgi:hypothetical protein
MHLMSQNKLKVNRLANRQRRFIGIAPKPFSFSAETGSNRLYIGCFGEGIWGSFFQRDAGLADRTCRPKGAALYGEADGGGRAGGDANCYGQLTLLD